MATPSADVAARRAYPDIKAQSAGVDGWVIVETAPQQPVHALTTDDARALRDQLNDALGADVAAPCWNWHSGTDRSYLFLGKLYVGMVRQYPGLKSYKASWGAWLMTDDQGESVGWHATESEARAALEQAARKAVGGE